MREWNRLVVSVSDQLFLIFRELVGDLRVIILSQQVGVASYKLQQNLGTSNQFYVHSTPPNQRWWLQILHNCAQQGLADNVHLLRSNPLTPSY